LKKVCISEYNKLKAHLIGFVDDFAGAWWWQRK